MRAFIYLTLLISVSCDSLLGGGHSPLDNKEPLGDRVELEANKVTQATDWIYCNSTLVDLTKYEHIDSIIFVPNLRSQSDEKKCYAELYNYSINQPVNGSLVESRFRYTLHKVNSSNLVNSIPKTRNELGIRFRSSEKGHHVEIGVGSHLVIYYN